MRRRWAVIPLKVMERARSIVKTVGGGFHVSGLSRRRSVCDAVRPPKWTTTSQPGTNRPRLAITDYVPRPRTIGARVLRKKLLWQVGWSQGL